MVSDLGLGFWVWDYPLLNTAGLRGPFRYQNPLIKYYLDP